MRKSTGATMNVSLTSELESFVTKLVQSGGYGSQSEVVRAALRLLLQQEEERELKLTQMRDVMAEGFRGIAEGKGKYLTADAIKAKAKLQSK